MAVFFSVKSSFAEEKQVFGIDTSVSMYSQYAGGVSGFVFFDEAVIQPSITLNHNPSGLYAMLWGSYSPQDGFNSDYGDEVDYIAGINRDIGPVNIDFYYAYFNCYKLNSHSAGDSHAVGTVIAFPEILKLEPFIEAEYDFIKGASRQNGLMYRVGARTAPVENLSLELSAGGHSEIYGTRTELASFARLAISYKVELAKNLALTPEINFQKRVGYSQSNGGMTEDVIWGGVTLDYSF